MGYLIERPELGTASMAKPDKSPAYEYTVDSQWAGWWGGYGAERLLEKEINQRASEGWRLIRFERAK